MRQHRRCCGMITTTNCPEVRVRLSAELAARHLQPDRRGRVALEHRRRGSKCGCAPEDLESDVDFPPMRDLPHRSDRVD